jgi:beta-phosphoglucomutase-like phosphatase (HAD superfamily)
MAFPPSATTTLKARHHSSWADPIGRVGQPTYVETCQDGAVSRRSLVIFDCDGVLVDSERLTVAIEARYLAEIGWPLTSEEIVRRFLGRTEDAMVAAIEEHLGRPVSATWRSRWLAETQAALDDSLEAVPGVREAIETLRHDGYDLCVGSSGRPEKIERSLAKTGLLSQFHAGAGAHLPCDHRGHAIFSAVEVAHGKPAPDLFLHAAETMGVETASCLVIEDSRHGVTAALTAGMHAVGFTGSLTPAADLAAAHVVIDDMAALPAAVTRLLPRPGQS